MDVSNVLFVFKHPIFISKQMSSGRLKKILNVPRTFVWTLIDLKNIFWPRSMRNVLFLFHIIGGSEDKRPIPVYLFFFFETVLFAFHIDRGQ